MASGDDEMNRSGWRPTGSPGAPHSGDGRQSDQELTIRTWMRKAVGDAIGVPAEAVKGDAHFRDLGLSSVEITALVHQLSERLGRSIAPTAAWEHPTPAGLALHAANLATSGGTAVGTGDNLRGGGVPVPDPVAVVGLGCRFSGGITSPADFWWMLCGGRTGIGEVPAARWDAEAYFDEDATHPGTMTTRWGGFLDDVDRFDAAFFGLSPREATQMDPQQRVALEVAWEALEDAGMEPSRLRGSAVGVFMGSMWSDYARLTSVNGALIDPFTATGQDTSIISARVSYFLDFRGPSLTVNTACSSSAVAIHLACQSLRSGESKMALAGGVHVMASPHSTVAMTKFGAMNPAGQCRAFDAAANGYVRGEGAGVVILKPLSSAIADGDRIYCVIRGSAMNSDGFSNGLTAPNPDAQRAMLRDAYAAADLEPGAIQYVETHGPGTILGDPLEAGAIGAVLGVGHSGGTPLRIGSVKTNIGHTEAAAGVAGLIKTALCLYHRRLVPNLHFEHPNPHIDFQALHLRVQTELQPWPRTDEPPRAGVSSFGFGGTNCHIVLEAAPNSRAVVLPVSSDSFKTLHQALTNAVGVLSQADGEHETTALCRELALRDQAAPCRAAVVATKPDKLTEAMLHRLLDRVATSTTPRPRLVFVCPGQGGQWLGMGRGLLGAEPVFRNEIEACDRRYVRNAGGH